MLGITQRRTESKTEKKKTYIKKNHDTAVQIPHAPTLHRGKG